MINTELNFEFEIDDWIAFQEDFLSNSKTFQKSIKGSQLSFVILFVGVILIDTIFNGFQGWSMTIVYLMLSGLWFFYAPRILFGVAMKQTKAMIEEGKNKNILCMHYFLINEDGVFFESEFHKEDLLWKGVERVNETEKYYFIYVTGLSAFAIPKEKISEENIKIIDTLVENYRNMV